MVRKHRLEESAALRKRTPTPKLLNRPLLGRPAKLAAIVAGLLCFVAFGVLPKETPAEKALVTIAFVLCPTLIFWTIAAPWKLGAVLGVWLVGALLSASVALVVAIPLMFIPDEVGWFPMWLRGGIALLAFLIFYYLWNRRVQFPFENRIRFRSMQNTLPPPEDYDNVFRW
jgi:hypothetical protein